MLYISDIIHLFLDLFIVCVYMNTIVCTWRSEDNLEQLMGVIFLLPVYVPLGWNSSLGFYHKALPTDTSHQSPNFILFKKDFVLVSFLSPWHNLELSEKWNLNWVGNSMVYFINQLLIMGAPCLFWISGPELYKFQTLHPFVVSVLIPASRFLPGILAPTCLSNELSAECLSQRNPFIPMMLLVIIFIIVIESELEQHISQFSIAVMKTPWP